MAAIRIGNRDALLVAGVQAGIMHQAWRAPCTVGYSIAVTGSSYARRKSATTPAAAVEFAVAAGAR